MNPLHAETNRVKAVSNKHKRLENSFKKEIYRIKGNAYQKKKYHEKDVLREKRQAAARVQTTKRLKEDTAYRERNKARARITTKQRINLNADYKEINRERAKLRMERIGHTLKYRWYNRIIKFVKRNNSIDRNSNGYNCNGLEGFDKEIPCNNEPKLLSSKQKYCIRRCKLLAAAKRRAVIFNTQKEMHRNSKQFSLLEIQLLFSKSDKFVHKSCKRIKTCHMSLQKKASSVLEKLSDKTYEVDVVNAFGGTRLHTKSGEPYFWEDAYRCLSDVVLHKQSIPIDNAGKAHIFKTTPERSAVNDSHIPLLPENGDCLCSSYAQRTDQHLLLTRSIDRERPLAASDYDQPIEHQCTAPAKNNLQKMITWYCNDDVCRLDDTIVQGVTELLSNLKSVKLSKHKALYMNINSCCCEKTTNKRGHSLCCTHQNCSSRLLMQARLLSCHFPMLRGMLRRIYDILHLCLASVELENSMLPGCNADQLQEALNIVQSIIGDRKIDGGKHVLSTSLQQVRETQLSVDEEYILQNFGIGLKQVTSLRDTYASTACDVCEQLRSDLAPLKFYDGKKGFDSQKMVRIIELLYQHKTSHEDIEPFLESIFICSYCSGKLRSNKELPRSAFNCLNVEATPDCIGQLNMFERTLIKFCMTCVAVVRLGQITNTSRPKNELTAALKGRIAYLPLNLSANATFLPDNILNLDSLVLLVAGQPTKDKKVWTTLVDLNKIHTALGWLREHNHLYKDVPYYSVDDLSKIMSEKLNTSSVDMPHEDTSALIKKLDAAAKSHLYESFSIQPLSTDLPADVLADYQLDKVHGQSMDIFDSDLDLKAYPELFPTGQNGIKDARRKVKIGTSDFLKSRLLNQCPKFRLNISYLFHSFQLQEVSNMCHSVGHMLRTVTGNGLSARELYERLTSKDGEIQSKMFSLMANLRGSKEYFLKLGMDIKWMIRLLGPPTLFVTCSTAEWFSEPFIQHLRTANSTVTGVEKMTPAELCAMDPVSVSIHFHKKWEAIFTKLILAKEKPLFGPVDDYFWRIEYQSRGAPHVHCLLWIKDAPLIGKDSLEAIESYICSIATCQQPNSSVSPTLHNLVSRFQVHKCNKYCTKSYKKNGNYYKKCRFGFPRPVKAKLDINDVIDCLAAVKSKQPRKRLYHLPRQEGQQYINDYNPALLLANQANVDVQYIGHLASRLPYYVTEYMTKHERAEQDDLWRDIYSSSKSLGSNAMSFMLQSVKSRQVGANEAADRLLGHKLYSKSRQMRFADLQPKESVKRVLKPANVMKNLLEIQPDSTDIYYPHWVLDLYPARPSALEDVSLHDFMGWYEKEKEGRHSENKLLNLNLYIRRRTKCPYIITHQIVNANQSEEKHELYFYYMLKLFKPWRSEHQLRLPDVSYSETFKSESTNYPTMQEYHERHMTVTLRDEKMSKAIEERAALNEKEQEIVTVQEGALQGCIVDHISSAMQDVVDIHQRATSHHPTVHSNTEQMYKDMNIEQTHVVDYIFNSVFQNKVIRYFVSGQGGTGKSRIIHLVHRMICERYKSAKTVPIVLAAPTGLAAFNINGITIHRLLCLPVEHGKPADYHRLNEDQLSTIRLTLRDLKVLVVDEVSMISSLTLLYIHLRLTEIMACQQLFGGISVIFFADLLQLPPVKGNQPFMTVSFTEAKQRIGSVGIVDLWSTFEYYELTINMRQSNDIAYASLLSHVRTGNLTDPEFSTLVERFIAPGRRATADEICTRYQMLVKDGENPLILMPRLAQCEEINTKMLHILGLEIVVIHAIDCLESSVNYNNLAKVQSAFKKKEDDVTRTAGLETNLTVCIGATVMLKRNLNVDAGLVNGSIGLVAGFVQNKDVISAIRVQFSGNAKPVHIQRERSTFEVLKGIYYSRKQFPLVLSFAITVHKAQGLTLQSVIVDAGPGCFDNGMVYVALSRVVALPGLHLIDLDRSRLKCDTQAKLEYNRLRQKYMPHLGQLSIERMQPRCKTKSVPELVRSIGNCAEDCQQISANFVTETDRSICPAISTTHNEIFQYCKITTMNAGKQNLICNKLNLAYSDDASEMVTCNTLNSQVTDLLQSSTISPLHVRLYKIGEDGNCLFRALSLGVTQSQNQYGILRKLIVDQMKDGRFKECMMNTFYNNTNAAEEVRAYSAHLEFMQQEREWGTEQEIVAAANLFDSSILCISKYNAAGDYCIQHFSPHFASSIECTSACHHQSLYLLNNSGNHYQLLTVVVNEQIQ